MSRSIPRLAGAVALLACMAFAMPEARAHYDDAYYHDYHDLPSQSRWMSNLGDATPVGSISMPGTHGSAARHGGWISENQTLTISQQLDAGIRFLDLRTRHSYNRLVMHHGSVYQHASFESVLDQIVAFLQRNPTETVFIRLKEEHVPEGKTRDFESTVNSYFPKYGKHFVADARWDMPLRATRGKIFLLRDYSGLTLYKGIEYQWETVRQDDHHLGSNWDLYGKWEKVKHLIDLANRSGPNPAPFINYLSGSGGAFPYFVASGHSDPRTNAPRLSTGMVTPFFTGWYPDFPRDACFIGMCTIVFEGTNTLAKHYLQKTSPSYVGIVAADFPGPGLINAVIGVNFNHRPFVSEANGKCLDIEGGVAQGRALISWPCHGGRNQQVTMRGDQLLIGGLCLDVAGGNTDTARARVVAWPCHGGANQRWAVETNGRIFSLMPGGTRCLRVDALPGNAIGLSDCVARAQTRFRLRH